MMFHQYGMPDQPVKGRGGRSSHANGEEEGEASPSLWRQVPRSIGPLWIMTAICSYTMLTLLAHRVNDSREAHAIFRKQVPSVAHDRSMLVFATAFVIDVLNIAFERHTTKLDYVLLPAFIKGMATFTNVLVRFYFPALLISPSGRVVVLQRYICWMHTTPTILTLIKFISTTITLREHVIAVIFDEIMLVTGVLGLITEGWQQVFWVVVTHAALLPIFPFIIKGFSEAVAASRSRSVKSTLWLCLGLMIVLWTIFATIWDLALLDKISPMTEEALYLVCDFCGKVLFSSTLMLSSFKGMEARREDVMRSIEESSKQKLIEELKELLEQKERFMNSVSHELRTPLNGIIGISEGMLSGCCGVLSEQVRRQIYIIRTSGARLLALINDVMDAALLKRNQLVLKQEQVPLRLVVDDVMDLTRSLVDTQVELRNTVSPRIAVVGDPGRIVQILNNLLGNAAKFTPQGLIKVSARTFDGGKLVAISVSDTGIGIPRNKLASIFQPFEQVDMSISRHYGGFGLGLNIVQDLVQSHGGDIWVESTAGKGSIFTFTLPAGERPGSMEGEEGGGVNHSSHPHAHHQPQPLPALPLTNSRSLGVTPTTMPSLLSGMAPLPFSGRLAAIGGVGGGVPQSPLSALLDQASKGIGASMTNEELVDEMMQRYNEINYTSAELSAMASSKPLSQQMAQDAGGGGGGSSRRRPRKTHSRAGNLHDTASPASSSPLPTIIDKGGQLRVNSPSPLLTPPQPQQQIQGQAQNAAHGGVRPGSAAASPHPSSSGPPTLGPAGRRRSKDAPNRARIKEKLRTVHQNRSPSPHHSHQGFQAGGGGGGGLGGGSLTRRSTAANSSSVSVNDSSSSNRPFFASRHPGRHQLMSVDDDRVNQAVVKAMLSSTGYDVITFMGGQDALDHLKECDVLPDVILLDQMMPGVDGFEVLSQLRGMFSSRAHIPVIMVSAKNDEESIVRGLDCGADDYVTKPYQRAEFLARIRGQLGISAAMDMIDEEDMMMMGGDEGGSGGGSGEEGEEGEGGAEGGGCSEEGGVGLRRGGRGGDLQQGQGPASGVEPTILCIDDDECHQMILQGMLETNGFCFVRAGTGEDGMAILLGTGQSEDGGEPYPPPNLVLLECSLPDVSGFELCRRIRATLSKAQLPVIVVSSRYNEQAVVEGLDCGANDYVTKPLRRGELLARIRMHLRVQRVLAQQQQHLLVHKLQAAELAPFSPAAAASSWGHHGEGRGEGASQAAAGSVPLDSRTLPPSHQAGPGGDRRGVGERDESFSPAGSSTSGSLASSTLDPRQFTPEHLRYQHGAAAGGGRALGNAGLMLMQPVFSSLEGGATGQGQETNSIPSMRRGVGEGGGGGGGGAGVMVARIAEYPALCDMLGPEALVSVTGRLVAAFSQLVKSSGCVKVECSGEFYVAALPFDPPRLTSSATGLGSVAAAAVASASARLSSGGGTEHGHHGSAPVARRLLKLAGGVLEAAAAVRLPVTQAPLHLHVLVHVGHYRHEYDSMMVAGGSRRSPLAPPAPSSFGEVMQVAREASCRCPLLAVCATLPAVQSLAEAAAAGVSEGGQGGAKELQHAMQVTQSGDGSEVFVLEVHPLAQAHASDPRSLIPPALGSTLSPNQSLVLQNVLLRTSELWMAEVRPPTMSQSSSSSELPHQQQQQLPGQQELRAQDQRPQQQQQQQRQQHQEKEPTPGQAFSKPILAMQGGPTGGGGGGLLSALLGNNSNNSSLGAAAIPTPIAEAAGGMGGGGGDGGASTSTSASICVGQQQPPVSPSSRPMPVIKQSPSFPPGGAGEGRVSGSEGSPSGGTILEARRAESTHSSDVTGASGSAPKSGSLSTRKSLKRLLSNLMPDKEKKKDKDKNA